MKNLSKLSTSLLNEASRNTFVGRLEFRVSFACATTLQYTLTDMFETLLSFHPFYEIPTTLITKYKSERIFLYCQLLEIGLKEHRHRIESYRLIHLFCTLLNGFFSSIPSTSLVRFYFGSERCSSKNGYIVDVFELMKKHNAIPLSKIISLEPFSLLRCPEECEKDFKLEKYYAFRLTETLEKNTLNDALIFIDSLEIDWTLLNKMNASEMKRLCDFLIHKFEKDMISRLKGNFFKNNIIPEYLSSTSIEKHLSESVIISYAKDWEALYDICFGNRNKYVWHKFEYYYSFTKILERLERKAAILFLDLLKSQFHSAIDYLPPLRNNGRMLNGLRLLKNPRSRQLNITDSKSLTLTKLPKASKEKIDYDFVMTLLSNPPNDIEIQDMQKVIKALTKNNCTLKKLTIQKLRTTLPAGKHEAIRLSKIIDLIISIKEK